MGMKLDDVIAKVRESEDLDETLRIVQITVTPGIAGKNPPETVALRFARPVIVVGDNVSFRTVDGQDTTLE